MACTQGDGEGMADAAEEEEASPVANGDKPKDIISVTALSESQVKVALHF